LLEWIWMIKKALVFLVFSLSLTACTLPLGKYAYIAPSTSTLADTANARTSTSSTIPIQYTETPSVELTPSQTITETLTNTSEPSLSPVNTDSPTPASTIAVSATWTGSPTITQTIIKTRTATSTVTSTIARTSTPSPTSTKTGTVSPGAPSLTNTFFLTRTVTGTSTLTKTPTATTQSVTPPPPTLSSSRTNTRTPTLTYTSTYTRTATATLQPTYTFTNTFTGIPPTATFTRTNTSIPPTTTFSNTSTNSTTSTIVIPSAPPPTATQTRTPTTIPPTSTAFACNPTYNSGFESQVIALINAERAKLNDVNIGPLTGQNQLGNAARGHSQDMSCKGFFSHTGSDGSSPSGRVSRAGYSWSAVAENIAAGYGDPASVVAGWMGSQGHKDNILSPNYTEIGIGYVYLAGSPYGAYWTADFAKP
jgi:uncharacterized protein YkwD